MTSAAALSALSHLRVLDLTRVRAAQPAVAYLQILAPTFSKSRLRLGSILTRA